MPPDAAVNSAIPSFRVEVVAAKLAIPVAFAVALALTIRMSAVPPEPLKSVMVSVPESTRNVSAPAFPV